MEKGKLKFTNQMLQKQFTIPLHTKGKSKFKIFELVFLGYFKSLDIGNKTLGELVSVIITHTVVYYFFFHGTHGNFPETLGLLLYCNILQRRERWVFFPLSFEIISHAIHGPWLCSKNFLINLTL